MRALTRLLTLTAAVAAMTLAAAVAASADSITITDKRSDVYLVGTDTDDLTRAQKSFAYGLDVKSVQIVHGSKYLSVEITFAKLKRQDGSFLHTSVWFARGETSQDQYAFDASILGGKSYATVQDLSDNKYRCGLASSPANRIVTKTTVGENGTFYAQIPRSCLRSPGKIKAQIEVRSYTPSADESYHEPISRTLDEYTYWSRYIVKG